MSLRDAFKRQGDMLFRYRGWTFLAALALFLLALRDSDWIEARFGDAADDVYDFACLGVSLAGLAVRVLVAGTVPGRTSGRNTRKGQVATALNSTGAYSVVRHPLYFANFVIALGLALVPGSPWFAVTLVLGFALVFERIMLAEEEFLRSRFGAEFEEWAERTPAFIPAALRAASITAGIPMNASRPARNASTAISLAAFITIGAAPPCASA